MTQSNDKGARKRGKFREFLRKRVVALKRKPQMIAFLVLLAGFVYYTLNLTIISHTTSLIKNGSGLSAFITILASTLALVTFLRTYPHRKNTNIVMLIFTLVLLCGTVLSDAWYHQLIVGAVSKPGNAIIYNVASADSEARAMIVSRAKKIDEDNAQSVLDEIKGEDGKSIIEDKLVELVTDGRIDTSGLLAEGVENTLENRLMVFYDEDKEGDLVLKSYRGVQMRVQDTFRDMRSSLTVDGSGNLTAETLDLGKLRSVIESGKLGIRHQVFNEDGSVNLDGFNAAYRDLNGKALFNDVNCHFARDNYIRISVRDDAVEHGFADRLFKVTYAEDGTLVAQLDNGTDDAFVRIVLDEDKKAPVAAELTTKESESTYRVDKIQDVVVESDVLDVLLARLKASEEETVELRDAVSGRIILQRADALYMDQVKGRENFKGSGELSVANDYKLRYAGEGVTYRVSGDYDYIAQAHRVLIVHLILLLAGIFLMVTKPLYGMLIRKINTSIQVEENQDMGTIDISGEE